jgi:hypothetical protein
MRRCLSGWSLIAPDRGGIRNGAVVREGPVDDQRVRRRIRVLGVVWQECRAFEASPTGADVSLRRTGGESSARTMIPSAASIKAIHSQTTYRMEAVTK